MTDTLAFQEDVQTPPRFTQSQVGWRPWLRPLEEDELTEAQIDAMVQSSRAKNPYFRLLARDADALRERTKTDFDIFYNTEGGLPRADREIAATAASRLNGCVYCASVHAGFSTHHSKRRDDVQRLLDEGVAADMGDERWNAIVRAAVALTQTPPRFGDAEVAALRDAGLSEAELLDAIQSGAFFSWANRLMLSLGEPAELG